MKNARTTMGQLQDEIKHSSGKARDHAVDAMRGLTNRVAIQLDKLPGIGHKQAEALATAILTGGKKC